MESKYNLLTRLLKNIKNVVNPDGSVAGSGGVLVVHETEAQTELGTTYTLDATYADIASAVAACIVREVNEYGMLSQKISYVDKLYPAGGPDFETMRAVHFSGDSQQIIYSCKDPNDYPVYLLAK